MVISVFMLVNCYANVDGLISYVGNINILFQLVYPLIFVQFVHFVQLFWLVWFVVVWWDSRDSGCKFNN